MFVNTATVCQVQLEPLEQAQVLVLIEQAKARDVVDTPTVDQLLKQALTIGLHHLMNAMVHEETIRYVAEG